MKLFEAANAKIVKMITADFVAGIINIEINYLNVDREDEDLNTEGLPIIEKVSAEDITDEQMEKIASAYRGWIATMVELHSVEYKGLSLPGDVWDAAEEIAKEIANTTNKP
jgi:hypothetical protein